MWIIFVHVVNTLGHGSRKGSKSSTNTGTSKLPVLPVSKKSRSEIEDNHEDSESDSDDGDDDAEILEGGINTEVAAPLSEDDPVPMEDMRETTTTEPCDEYNNSPLNDETDLEAPQSNALNPSSLKSTDSHY